MNLLEWLGIWFGPQQTRAHPLRDHLDEGRRLRFAEDYPGALAAFERARAQLAPDDALAATAIDLHEIETQIDAGEFADAEERIDHDMRAGDQAAQDAKTLVILGVGDEDPRRPSCAQMRVLRWARAQQVRGHLHLPGLRNHPGRHQSITAVAARPDQTDDARRLG